MVHLIKQRLFIMRDELVIIIRIEFVERGWLRLLSIAIVYEPARNVWIKTIWYCVEEVLLISAMYIHYEKKYTSSMLVT